MLGHEPHSLLMLVVAGFPEELDDSLVELGRPGFVVLVPAGEVVSVVVLLPNKREKVDVVVALFE